MFGEGFSIKLDDGDATLKSWMGTCCSLLLLTITGLYAYLKFDVFITKKEVSILSATQDLFFTDDDQFSYETGSLNIAAAFTSFNSETELELDPTYGELFFNSYSWGADENGKLFTDRVRLSDHTCSREELHLTGDGSMAKFFPIYESS